MASHASPALTTRSRATGSLESRGVSLFPFDESTVTGYYASLSVSIEETFGRMREFYYFVEDMKEDLPRLRHFAGMAKMQWYVRLMAAEYIEWLDSQITILERVYLDLSVKLARRDWVAALFSGPRPAPQLPENHIMLYAGKILALWLRESPGIHEEFGEEEASDILYETITPLPEGVVSPPESEETAQSPVSATLQPAAGATSGVEGEEAAGDNGACAEGQQPGGGDEGLPPVGEEDPTWAMLPPIFESDIDGSYNPLVHPSAWSTTATVGSDDLSDTSSNPSVEESYFQKEERKQSEAITKSRRKAMIELIRGKSTSDAVFPQVWRLADRLLRLYYDHMRQTGLPLLYMLESSMAAREGAPPAEWVAHMQKSLELMAEELAEADRHLMAIGESARSLEGTDWWLQGQVPFPVIPDDLLEPVVRPRQVIAEDIFSDDVWRQFRFYFRCHLQDS